MGTVTTNAELQKLRTQVISAGVSSMTPVHVASAQGAFVRDVEGREYIDFAGGIGVMNVGHCHPKVVAAIKDQAEKFPHTCFMVSPYECHHPRGQALPADARALPQEGHVREQRRRGGRERGQDRPLPTPSARPSSSSRTPTTAAPCSP